MSFSEDPWATDNTHSFQQEQWQGDILQPGPLDDSLAAQNGHSELSTDFVQWSNAIRTSYNSLSEDIVTIQEIPEREGILFKHTNYLIHHLIPLGEDNSPDRKVVRRYSDFVWLVEVLLTKYPFRLIPELPPKKLASDPLFLERRLKGLGRFLNQLMKHPVLSVEPLVVMFLTVPTDLSSWRKQAQYDSTEEYHDRKISQGFITLWDDTYLESWKSVESQINDSWERWMKLTVIIERIEIRTRQISQDNAKFTQLLDGFNESIQKVYQDGDIALISNNLANVSSSVDSHRGLLDDESQESHTVISEQFKQYGDILLAMRALFDRYKRHGGNSIDQLTRRLEANKARLQEMNGKPDVKGIDVDRINELIEKDTKEIEKQHNRDWLIKETILTEFIMFQETQYQITKVVQIWIGNKMKYSELYSNNWGKLLGSLHDMPSSRHS